MPRKKKQPEADTPSVENPDPNPAVDESTDPAEPSAADIATEDTEDDDDDTDDDGADPAPAPEPEPSPDPVADPEPEPEPAIAAPATPAPHYLSDADFKALTAARVAASVAEQTYNDAKKDAADAKKEWENRQASFERMFDRIMAGAIGREPQLPFDGIHMSDVKQPEPPPATEALPPEEQPAVVELRERLSTVAGIVVPHATVAKWSEDEANATDRWLKMLEDTSDHAVVPETPAHITALFSNGVAPEAKADVPDVDDGSEITDGTPFEDAPSGEPEDDARDGSNPATPFAE
jgi:hypothetical protein